MSTSHSDLAYAWRPGREPALVFLHGLGCDNRGFAAAFDAPELLPYALLAPDLVGYGATPTTPADFGFTMREQADRIAGLSAGLGLERIALVTHSMGGAVGILLAESWRGEVVAFANGVGNLVPADCFFSRRFLEFGEELFIGKAFQRVVEETERRDAQTGRPPSSFPAALRRTTARAVFESSRDLVDLSDHGDLLARFLRLPCAKLFLQDEENRIDAGVGEALAAAAVPLTVIPDCGHGLMEDNPDLFYAAVAELIARADASG